MIGILMNFGCENKADANADIDRENRDRRLLFKLLHFHFFLYFVKVHQIDFGLV
mgnify:FL=1